MLTGDLAEAVPKLKQAHDRDILMHGYGPVAKTLVRDGLLDELCLWLHPMLAGVGPVDDMLFSDGLNARLTCWRPGHSRPVLFCCGIGPSELDARRGVASSSCVVLHIPFVSRGCVMVADRTLATGPGEAQSGRPRRSGREARRARSAGSASRSSPGAAGRCVRRLSRQAVGRSSRPRGSVWPPRVAVRYR